MLNTQTVLPQVSDSMIFTKYTWHALKSPIPSVYIVNGSCIDKKGNTKIHGSRSLRIQFLPFFPTGHHFWHSPDFLCHPQLMMCWASCHPSHCHDACLWPWIQELCWLSCLKSEMTRYLLLLYINTHTQKDFFNILQYPTITLTHTHTHTHTQNTHLHACTHKHMYTCTLSCQHTYTPA